MATPRWQPASREALEEVLAQADSVLEASAVLGICDNTLRRYCRERGIDLSPTRGTGGSRPPQLAPEERIARDTEMERVKEERTYYHSLYEEALTQIRSQEDLVAGLAEQFANPRPAPRFTNVKRKANGKRPEREVVLQISDWQMGELVRPEDVGGVNEYSWSVFEHRLERWARAVISSICNQQQAYHVRRGVVCMLGDMVEGHDVYNGQAWHLDKDAAMQALDGATAWAAALAAVIEATPEIAWHVYCVPGNHGKPGGRKGGAVPATFSFDYLFYRLLEKDLANYKVAEFAIEPAGRLLFWSAGHVFLAIHGNEVRAWGGFPAYGLDKADARLSKELDQAFAYLLCGHWHQAAMMPSGRGARIINGSAVGANQLTQAAVLGATLPTQNMLWISQEYGLAELGLIHLAPGEYRQPQIHGSART
jgi:hypothetical protein